MAILTSELESSQIPLPSLRSKPSFASLYAALESLALEPNAWNGSSKNQDLDAPDPKAVNRYLLSVVSSELTWFQEGSEESEAMDHQDKIWELANRRMAERCGRTAMPEMTRTWIIHTSKRESPLAFSIREPPLTGDNLGLKTWGTAFTMAQKLEDLGTEHFPHLLKKQEESLSGRILELGSGTGLVGIAAAAVWGLPVLLTDLPEIQPNLSHNALQNAELVKAQGGKIDSTVLDWKDPYGFTESDFELMIAADPMYDNEHPRLVARMIQKFLKGDEQARALVAVPLRDRHTADMAAEFREAMLGMTFCLAAQGEEICRDDWEENGGEGEGAGVICWWSIWSRKTP